MATFQWITNSGIGDWSVASNWSSASVPGALDSATIGVSGTVTVTVNSAQSVGSLTLADANATVALNNGLTLGSTLNLTAGKFDLNSGGTIVGGTITGSGLLFPSGTLSGVANRGHARPVDERFAADGYQRDHADRDGRNGPGERAADRLLQLPAVLRNPDLDNAGVSIGGVGGTDFLRRSGRARR